MKRALVINHAENTVCSGLEHFSSSKLKMLHLSDVGISEQQLERILLAHAMIDTLTIDGGRFSSDAGLNAIASLKHLRELSLLDPVDVASSDFSKRFVEAITSLQQLEVLAVAGRSFDGTGLNAIVLLPNLRELGLVQTKIQAAELASCRLCKKIERLFYSGGSVNDDIVRMLAAIPSIKELILPRTEVSPSVAEELAKNFPAVTIKWHKIMPTSSSE